jgi:flagellar biosynthetic protein FliR
MVAALWLIYGARFMGMMITVPFFSSRLIPFRLRAAFIGLLVFVLLGGNTTPGRDQVATLLQAGATVPALVASEVLVGMAAGWAALLVLAAARAAAILISEQVGFGFGGIVDPSVPQDESVLRAFYGSLAVFVLLAGDVHLRFLRVIAESFAAFPPGALASGGALAGLGRMSLAVGSLFFETALILVFPVTAALFLASVAQGVLTRLFPELETVLFGFLLR